MILADLEKIKNDAPAKQQLEDILINEPQPEDTEQTSYQKRLKAATIARTRMNDVWRIVHGGKDVTPEESLAQQKMNQGPQALAPEDTAQ